MADKACSYCNNGHCTDCDGEGWVGVNRCTYCVGGDCKVCLGSGREHIVEELDP